MRKLIFALLIGTVGGGCYVHDRYAYRHEGRRHYEYREARRERPRYDVYYYVEP